jgi:hypothetical protein
MEIISIILAFLAGAGSASSIALYFRLKQSEIERKLWTNKILIREGQARIFADSEIYGEPTETEKRPPVQFKSPFRQGLQNKTDEIQQSKRTSTNLPPQVQEKIEQAAKAAGVNQ